jgi:hypothetical protein
MIGSGLNETGRISIGHVPRPAAAAGAMAHTLVVGEIEGLGLSAVTAAPLEQQTARIAYLSLSI